MIKYTSHIKTFINIEKTSSHGHKPVSRIVSLEGMQEHLCTHHHKIRVNSV